MLERLQLLPILGVRTFQDVLDLTPGERWERSLYRHIDISDIVLLFWSNAAKRSKWVRKEVRYALDRKHGDEFALPEIGGDGSPGTAGAGWLTARARAGARPSWP